MKIGITGAGGCVGSAFRGVTKHTFIPLESDVTNANEIDLEIKRICPDIVLHLAAISSVDECEENPDKAYQVNALGTNNTLVACASLGIPFVLLSSCHVFAGKSLFKPSERDIPDPVNEYGFIKLAAEVIVETEPKYGYVIRTSKLFGVEDNKTKQYVEYFKSILPWQPVPVITNRLQRSFMYVGDFVECLEYYFDNFGKMPKLLHIAGTKRVTWYKFILALREVLNSGKPLTPRNRLLDCATPRPIRGGLSVNKMRSLGFPMYDYRHGLDEMAMWLW